MVQLNFRGSKPIRLQIEEGIIRLIETGAVLRDEKMPAIRELAATMTLNPRMIEQSYQHLQQLGYLYEDGGDYYVAVSVNEQYRAKLLREFDQLVEELERESVSRDELCSRLLEDRKEVETNDDRRESCHYIF